MQLIPAVLGYAAVVTAFMLCYCIIVHKAWRRHVGLVLAGYCEVRDVFFFPVLANLLFLRDWLFAPIQPWWRSLRQPSQLVFIIGVPRAGTTNVHRSLHHCTGASSATTWDIIVPPRPGLSRWIRRLFRPLVAFIIQRTGVLDGDRHKVDLDEPEEEDHTILETNRGLIATLLTSRTLNHAMLFSSSEDPLDSESSPFFRDEHSMRGIDRTIRAVCDNLGSDIFVGKPLASSLYYDKLLSQFPQAQFVVVWRDPCKALASVYGLFRTQFAGCCHSDTMIRLCKLWYPRLYRNVIHLRKTRANDNRFAFVHFADWVQKPEQELARVVSQLKLPIVNTTPLPKDEGHVTDSMAAESKAWAEDVVRSEWEPTWRSIYKELGFPPLPDP